MNTSYICIILATIIVTIIIVAYVCYKNKEKFTKVDGLVKSSDTVVSSTIPKPTNYMSTDKDGAISTDPNINVNSLINIGGYPGRVGDVIVSNGSAPPVWAAGVGLSDFQGRFTESSGYQYLPGGLIMQWGKDPGMPENTSVPFPIPFPNDCLSFTATQTTKGSGAALYGRAIDRKSFYTYCTVNLYTTYYSFPGASNWFAIGY